MKVSDVMNPMAFTCRPGNTLNDAARIFWEHDCGCVPVVDDDGKAIGMLTDRDVCLTAYFQGAALRDMLVEGCMAREVVSVRPQDALEDALELMRAHRIRRLPVIDGESRPIGMLALGDVARALAGGADIKPKRLAKTLAAICEARISTPSLVLDIEIPMRASEPLEAEPPTIELAPVKAKTKPKSRTKPKRSSKPKTKPKGVR